MRFLQSVLNVVILISGAFAIILGILLVVAMAAESDALVSIFGDISKSVPAEKKLSGMFAFIVSGAVWLGSYGFQAILKRIVRARQ